MSRMHIRVDRSGIRNRDVPNQDHGSDIRRIAIVLSANDIFYVINRTIAANISADNDPARANKVPLKLRKFWSNGTTYRTVHDYQGLALVLNQLSIDAGVNVRIGVHPL